jgi:hypothetical protein
MMTRVALAQPNRPFPRVSFALLLAGLSAFTATVVLNEPSSKSAEINVETFKGGRMPLRRMLR